MTDKFKDLAEEFVAANHAVYEAEQERKRAETAAEQARMKKKDLSDKLLACVGNNVPEKFFRVLDGRYAVRVRQGVGVDVVTVE